MKIYEEDGRIFIRTSDLMNMLHCSQATLSQLRAGGIIPRGRPACAGYPARCDLEATVSGYVSWLKGVKIRRYPSASA